MRKTILTLTLALASALTAGGCGGADDIAADNKRAAGNNSRAVVDSGRPANAATPPATAANRTASDGHDHSDTAGARRISIEQARAEVEAGRAVFLDVRTDDAYSQGHIKGAYLIPEGTVAARASQLPKDKLIITYCA